MTCQRNWLYLESIFSAPDIQRQLPAEAKMFLTVDKSWKEVMRKVHRLPNALRAATQPGECSRRGNWDINIFMSRVCYNRQPPLKVSDLFLTKHHTKKRFNYENRIIRLYQLS